MTSHCIINCHPILLGKQQYKYDGSTLQINHIQIEHHGANNRNLRKENTMFKYLAGNPLCNSSIVSPIICLSKNWGRIYRKQKTENKKYTKNRTENEPREFLCWSTLNYLLPLLFHIFFRVQENEHTMMLGIMRYISFRNKMITLWPKLSTDS